MKKQELLALVEEGFQKPAWHGPNLRTALRGVTAEEAAWRPASGRHNIWEIVVHAAFWKYTVARRLTGQARNTFPEKGRNWFPRDIANSKPADAAKRWKDDLALLAQTHQDLRSAIAAVREADIERPMRSHRQTPLQNIVGIAMHDVYHAGQIQLLRTLNHNQRK